MLLLKKARGEELNEEAYIPLLNAFLKERIDHLKELVKDQDAESQPDTGYSSASSIHTGA